MSSNYIDPIKVRDINDYTQKEQTIIYVTFLRLDLYNNGKNCGPQFILKEMKRRGIRNIPSPATIGKILRDQYLTHGRTGYYPGDSP